MLFGLIKNTYYYTHLELCSNCWVTALNSTEILLRCLDIEWTVRLIGSNEMCNQEYLIVFCCSPDTLSHVVHSPATIYPST